MGASNIHEADGFPGEVAERLRSHGMKVTPQRELILRIVSAATAHPTADSVFAAARRQMPMISLKTVYQTLHDLAEVGELRTLDFGAGATRFDPNMSEHHHAVCTKCGVILDVDVAAVPRLHHGHGFVVDDVDVTFHGTCAACLRTA